VKAWVVAVLKAHGGHPRWRRGDNLAGFSFGNERL
jgi:hypothetical protein